MVYVYTSIASVICFTTYIQIFFDQWLELNSVCGSEEMLLVEYITEPRQLPRASDSGVTVYTEWGGEGRVRRAQLQFKTVNLKPT